MPKKQRKPATTSLGTFQQEEATIIASELLVHEGIVAVIDNLVTDSGPTTWWHVMVPERSALSAGTWLRGWKQGKEYGSIEMNGALRGESYKEARRRLGYDNEYNAEQMKLREEQEQKGQLRVDADNPRDTCDEEYI